MILKSLAKAFQIISDKEAFKGLVSKRKFSYASFKINRVLKKNIPELATIIDAGANQGQFALMALQFFPKANIYSFEPVPETFDILKRNLSDKAQVTAYNIALGSSEGHIKFYKHNYSHISSALTIDKTNNNPKYDGSVYKEISVPVTTLDNISQEIAIKGPVLLKLDVQGFEKEVIKGAAASLAVIDYILIEMPFFSLYDSQPLFGELNQMLNDLGYEIYLPMDANYGADNKIIEIDFLYRKKQ